MRIGKERRVGHRLELGEHDGETARAAGREERRWVPPESSAGEVFRVTGK